MSTNIAPLSDAGVRRAERRSLDVVASWTMVGVVGVGSTAVLFQRVLEVGPQRCVLRAATGVPCPLCGLSRCGVALVRLDPIHALQSDPLGVLVLAVVAVVALWTLLAAITSRVALPTARRWLPGLLAAVGIRWALEVFAAL